MHTRSDRMGAGLVALFLVGLLAFVAGCRSPRTQVPVMPAFDYTQPKLRDVLKELVVRLNVRDCPDKQVIRYTSWYGTTKTEQPHELKSLVAGEFNRVIECNFTPVNGERVRLAKVELSVTPNQIDLFDPYAGDARCSYEFSVKLMDPRSNDVKPFFEKTYSTAMFSPVVDGVIPLCECIAIQKVAVQFVEDIAKDQEVIRLLEDRNQEIPPEISDWQPRHLAGNAIRGNAYVNCNDWNREATKTWALRQIWTRCASELRLPQDDEAFRLFVFSENYEPLTGRWNFEFDALPSEPIFVLPRSEGDWRSGRCYIDIKRLKAKDGHHAMTIARQRIFDKVGAEGIGATTVELKRAKRHLYYNDVIVAEFVAK